MVIKHEALRNFPYNLILEAMQEFKKIMQAAFKDHIEMESCIEDPLVPMRTYQDMISPECAEVFGHVLQAAALGFISLLRFSILACANGQKRNSKDILK